MRLIIDQTDLVKTILKAYSFTVSKAEVMAVEVTDQPAGLSGILDVLDKSSINVEYM